MQISHNIADSRPFYEERKFNIEGRFVRGFSIIYDIFEEIVYMRLVSTKGILCMKKNF